MSASFWKQKYKSKQFAPIKNQTTPQEPPKKSIHKWTYGKGITQDHIKIASWNVNGIRSVYNRRFLEPYLQKNDVDILCVNQTKIDQVAYEKAPISLHGYNGYWNFCKCSAGYSGVAVFSKYLPISMEEDLPQPKHCHEGRTIVLEFQKFYLVAVYVPNSGSKLQRLSYRVNQFDIDFQKHLEKLRAKKHVIVAGDLNVVRDEIDIYKSQGKVQMSKQMPACTLEQRKNFDNLLKLGYIDSFRELYPQKVQYSWWNMKIQARKKNIGWRIDYILINEEMRSTLIDAVIQDQVLGSDHCPVQIMLDLTKMKQHKKISASEQFLKSERQQQIQGEYINFENHDSYSIDFEGDENAQYKDELLNLHPKINEKKQNLEKIIFELKDERQYDHQQLIQVPDELLNEVPEVKVKDFIKQIKQVQQIQKVNQVNQVKDYQKQALQQKKMDINQSQGMANQNNKNEQEQEKSEKNQAKNIQKSPSDECQSQKMIHETSKKVKRQPIKFQTISSQQYRKKK